MQRKSDRKFPLRVTRIAGMRLQAGKTAGNGTQSSNGYDRQNVTNAPQKKSKSAKEP